MDQITRVDILTPIEIEAFAQSIHPSNVHELGSLRWLEKHDRIEKLTMQAIVQALSNREETVKEMLISFEKLPVLVHDLVLVELWRALIFPKLLKENPQCSFSIHAILHHEATCINLIETVLYHEDAAESLEDSVLDIIDYCSHALNTLLATGPPQKTSSKALSQPADLQHQAQLIQFQVAFKALSSLRYIIEQSESVAGEVIPRLVVSSDTPMLLTALILQRPWIRPNPTGPTQEYNGDEQKWVDVRPQDRIVMGKIEAQLWLALYQLLMNSRVIAMYDMTDFRKDQLLRLRPLLHETTVDQIPLLNHFTTWLDGLAIGSFSSPPPKSPLILEMVSAMRPVLEAEITRDMDRLMETYRKELIQPSRDLMMAKAQKLSDTYNFENLEAVLPPSKCAKCGETASKRCSRCKNEWYCSRQCQVSHWNSHKKICDLMAS
ncbi:unnamed protein product [Allacma fusca]|uniref:Zinc finger MYND domain-containing protein 10 n=1 Tax=Allacma fusca TaxID=39272 RepID=A0A8J2JZX2_9HEXA|nr:unnamed protein product [Allacma fusca]